MRAVCSGAGWIRCAERAAWPAAALLALVPATAFAQTLPRLHITALGLHSDRSVVRPGESFHVTVHVLILEKRERLDELVLPALTNAVDLGDERKRVAAVHGTDFYETLTVAASTVGTASFTPAYIDAIDPANGRGMRYSSQPLTVRVASGTTVRDADSNALMALLRKAALTVAAVVIAFVIGVFALVRLARRPRRVAPPPAAPPVPVRKSGPVRDPLRDAFVAYRARGDDDVLDVLRNVLFVRAGAAPGATFADALRALGSRDPQLARVLAVAERARFGPVHERAGRARSDFTAGRLPRRRAGRMTTPQDVRAALAHTIVGQTEVVDALVMGLLSDGHVLLEGIPGVGKTLACRALAAAVGGVFKRVQFTPDLLPSDIVGTRIFDQRSGDFMTVRGPIFANVVLADEINRAPAKVQSALLEGMQERRATIGPDTLALPRPFAVLATMNPFDADGTYALPLAQLDRFLLNVRVGYPSRDDERAIVDRFSADAAEPDRDVATLADVERWQAGVREVHLNDRVRDYAVDLVRATRGARYVSSGASPRAALALAILARARAYLDGRTFAVPDDVRELAPGGVRHRVAFDYRLAIDGGDGDAVLAGIVASVPAP